MTGDSGLFNNTMGARAIRGELKEAELKCFGGHLAEENAKLDKMLSLACVTLSSNVGVGMHPTKWLTPEEWRNRIEGWVEK